MKDFIKKIFGITEMERAIAETKLALEAAEKAKEQAVAAAQKALEEEELAKISPKERATRLKEPWVSVLDTHVNKENIRNGFFELDWNEYFIIQLKQAGYGADGDRDEDIVDRWFRDIVYNMFAEAGIDTTRGAGFINVVPIAKGKSEVS